MLVVMEGFGGKVERGHEECVERGIVGLCEAFGKKTLAVASGGTSSTSNGSAPAMILIRSLLFNLAFYVSIIVQMIVMTPFYFLTPRKKAWFVPKNWARSNLWLQKVIVGCDHVIEGLEHIPDTACIIAPKHQSFWDAFAFVPRVPDPVYILKRELMWIPMFGWYVAKMKMIPIDRGSRSIALNSITAGARKAVADNRQIMIYPEGTRRAPGDEPSYKYGVAHLYGELGLPVIPIAHMAGLYWPRRKFLRYPGTIRCRVLPPIAPGLDKEVFLEELKRVTEAACDEFLVAAATGPNPPPMPPSAQRRLRELGVTIPG